MGLTKHQWAILTIAWLGWVFDIMDSALFVFAKEPMLTEFLGSPERYKLEGPAIEGKIQLLFLVGWALGGLVFGILADKWGRARTMIITILIYCLFTGLIAFCKNAEQVALVRFISALGIGGEWAAGAALVAETLPNSRRAFGAALLQTAAAVGPILAAFLNLGIAAENWRTLFLVGVIPAFVTVGIRFFVREPEPQEKTKTPFFEPLKEMFREPKWRIRALAALGIGFVGIAGAQNVAFWLPNLVKAVSEGASAEEVKNYKSWATFALHAGTIIGVLTVPFLCERWGRRRTIWACFLLSPVTILLATYSGSTIQRLLWTAPLMSICAIGVSAAFVLYFPELFPTRFRATGAGFAYNTGRIFSAWVPWFTGALAGMLQGSVVVAVLITSAVLLVIAFVSLPFAPETKGEPLPE
ncbi:MAG TPA: MFS transporter [Fimbriimonadaceae bacterium]|nr:MFS transporter [Fimbriimonadaceae bacterium]